MNFFEYEKTGPETLQKCEIERKMAALSFTIYAKIFEKERMQVLYAKKHTSAAACVTRLTFVYILYSLNIVCMYKKHTKVVSVSLLCKFCIVCTLFVCTKNIQNPFQLARCISFVQFEQYLYVQKTYISSFKPFLVQTLYKFCTFCKFFVYMQKCDVAFLYIPHIIIQNFDLYNFCIQNIYKFSALYNFCIHYVQFLQKYFGKTIAVFISNATMKQFGNQTYINKNSLLF